MLASGDVALNPILKTCGMITLDLRKVSKWFQNLNVINVLFVKCNLLGSLRNIVVAEL